MDPHPLDRPSAAEVARKAIKQRRVVWKEIVAAAAGNPRRKSGGGGDVSARFDGGDYEGGRNSRPASARSACSKNAGGKSVGASMHAASFCGGATSAVSHEHTNALWEGILLSFGSRFCHSFLTFSGRGVVTRKLMVAVATDTLPLFSRTKLQTP